MELEIGAVSEFPSGTLSDVVASKFQGYLSTVCFLIKERAQNDKLLRDVETDTS